MNAEDTSILDSEHFARPALAQEMADNLLGKNTFSDFPNGLFLSAQRRTGKSVFLQRDLAPALSAAGVMVIYVDLWVNKDKDPGLVIAESLAQALEETQGGITKLMKGGGVDSITLAGAFRMDLTKLGRADGSTLRDGLTSLINKTKKPVALIIDEAQHALTTQAGRTAMTALKSARDTINNKTGPKLMLIMSGSDRDKLMRLVISNTAPFYGSAIHPMPALGPDYIEHLAKAIGKNYPKLKTTDRQVLLDVFRQLGSRPQFMKRAIGESMVLVATSQISFEQALQQFAANEVAKDEAQMRATFMGLGLLERLVVWRILMTGAAFRPYDADALDFYTEKLGKKVTTGQIQTAIKSLREHEPSLIWVSDTKEFALEDPKMGNWFSKLAAAGQWPPGTAAGPETLGKKKPGARK